MPNWQRDLEALLAELDVALDAAASAPEWGVPLLATRILPLDDVPEHDLTGEACAPGVVSGADGLSEDAIEISAVRSEIAATIARMQALAEAGRIDQSLRDDVIFVLRALTRPRPFLRHAGAVAAEDAADAESAREWQLASAAAVLRFCRIVLKLTQTIARDRD